MNRPFLQFPDTAWTFGSNRKSPHIAKPPSGGQFHTVTCPYPLSLGNLSTIRQFHGTFLSKKECSNKEPIPYSRKNQKSERLS
eukprot:13695159-Heterocapsa_arctica.AAC.1